MGQHQRHLSEIPEETSREKQTVQERRIQIREVPVSLPATIYERNLDRSGPVREDNEVLTAEETPPGKRMDNCDLQTRPVVNSMAMESSPDWSQYDEEPTARNEQFGRKISIGIDRLRIDKVKLFSDEQRSQAPSRVVRVPLCRRLPSRHRANSEVTEPLLSEYRQDQYILDRARGRNDPAHAGAVPESGGRSASRMSSVRVRFPVRCTYRSCRRNRTTSLLIHRIRDTN